MMNIIETEIQGVFIIEPKVFGDSRGYFFESFSKKEFESRIGPVEFVQDNESKSCYGVVRGLHFQKPPHAQAKLVRVVKGKVLDVAVDLRKDSPTYGKHVSSQKTITVRCSSPRALHTASAFSLKKLCSNISVMIIMPRKPKVRLHGMIRS